MEHDLKLFADGDMTIVGERGITLSGGQKARLSMARAMYSDADIYLLDDPLSAVDSHVGKHIFENAIRGPLMKEKIVILVTHHLNFAQQADRVVYLSKGSVLGDGKFEELENKNLNLISIF